MRWRLLTAWIVIFTLAVIYVLVAVNHQNAQRRQDRNEQIASIIAQGNQECVRAFTAITNILNISITPEQRKKLTKAQRKNVDQIFAYADPKVNCPPQPRKGV